MQKSRKGKPTFVSQRRHHLVLPCATAIFRAAYEPFGGKMGQKKAAGSVRGSQQDWEGAALVGD